MSAVSSRWACEARGAREGEGAGVRTRALELVHVCFDSLYLLAFHVLQTVSIDST